MTSSGFPTEKEQKNDDHQSAEPPSDRDLPSADAPPVLDVIAPASSQPSHALPPCRPSGFVSL